MKHTRIAVATAAALLGAVALTGCAGVAAKTGSAQTGTNAAQAPATGDNADSTTPSDDSSSSDANTPAKFGQTFTYSDGLSVTVSAPKKFTPSDTAMGGEKFKT